VPPLEDEVVEEGLKFGVAGRAKAGVCWRGGGVGVEKGSEGDCIGRGKVLD